MKSIILKIALILLMLVPMPFSCTDKNECLDLDVQPYFKIEEIDFRYVDLYWKYKVKGEDYLGISTVSQDYDNYVYPGDSMALWFEATLLSFHSQNIMQPKSGFMQEAYACNAKRNGYAGTRELVSKIWVSNKYPFDDMHPAPNYDLSGIIDIFDYNIGWMSLNDYNKNGDSDIPFEAPKRFYLLIKRKPTRSPIQQFVIRYLLITEEGEPKQFVIETPVFRVR